MTSQEILDAILIADGYLLELQTAKLLKQYKGCDGVEQSNKQAQIIMVKEQLLYQIGISDYGEKTDHLYSCLLKAIETYSGASITIDPNANIPGIIIDVDIIGNDSPYEITIPWSDFIDNGEDGRIRYENADWRNWLPMLAVDNMPFLVEGTDFEVLVDGGFELLPGGNLPAIYDGQVIRSVGYEPWVAPPIVVGVALIDNQSSIDITYDDNGSGGTALDPGDQFIKDPIVNGQFLFIQYSGTLLELTIYNSDGSVFDHLGPQTGIGINIVNMDITKRYEAIITDI